MTIVNLLLYVDLENFFKDKIDLCSYSLLLGNYIFCCELHFILLFHTYAGYI